MSKAFNKWWDTGDLTNNNLFAEDTPAYWAWEGWVAGVKAEREEIADMVRNCDPRATPRGIAAAIRNRSTT